MVCVFFTFQEITGINVPLYYGPKLLGRLFQNGDSKVAEVVAGVQVTAIMTLVNVIATYFAFRWIDRAGRRPLAMGGFAGMAGRRNSTGRGDHAHLRTAGGPRVSDKNRYKVSKKECAAWPNGQEFDAAV